MNKNDVFSVLRTFSKPELKKFRLFLESPYFSGSTKLIDLFDYVKKFYPLFSDIRLEREFISKRLFPGLHYNDSTMRNLFSDLRQSALKFLMFENFSKSETDKLKCLLSEINQRNLKEEFGKAIDKYEKKSDGKFDYRYYMARHYMETQKFNFSYINEKVVYHKDFIKQADCLENSTRNLLLYFLTELSTHYLSLIIFSRNFSLDFSHSVLQKTGDVFSFEKMKGLFPENDEYFKVLEIYSAMVNMYTHHEETGFYYQYKDLVYKYSQYLTREEMMLHINYLSSYCIGKNPDNDEFKYELFGLYCYTLENEFYKDGKMNYLSPEFFRDILLLSLSLKKYDWTAEFIEKYSYHLPPEERDNMMKFSKAYLYFHTGEYSQALNNLNFIDLDFFIYKFDVKNLKLMIYFELGYLEEALYLIKTYNEFLRKNKIISTERKKRYISFIRFTSHLIYFRLGQPKQEIGYIKYRLTHHKATAFKSWLFEKMQSIEIKFSKTA